MNLSKNYNLFDNDLKGQVRSVKEISYEAIESFGKIVKGQRKREYFSDYMSQYDKDGRLIEITTYKSSGEILSKWVIMYDVNGNLLERIHYDINGNKFGKWFYKYNAEGLKSEKQWISPHADQCKKIISVYDEGRVAEQSIYNYDDSMYLKIKYQYDVQGNRTEKLVYNAFNRKTHQNTYTYNDENKLVEKEWRDFAAKIKVKESFIYDEKGNIIQKDISSFKDTSYCFNYIYDKNYNLVELNWIEKMDNKTRNGKSIYKYDAKSNWVERLDYKNDKVKFLVEREVLY